MMGMASVPRWAWFCLVNLRKFLLFYGLLLNILSPLITVFYYFYTSLIKKPKHGRK